jgi:hypothetical protein
VTLAQLLGGGVETVTCLAAGCLAIQILLMTSDSQAVNEAAFRPV